LQSFLCGRIAALIASLLAVVLVFAFVADSNELRTGAEPGRFGASVECGGFDSLPSAKLAEEVCDAGSDNESFIDAAISHVGCTWPAPLSGSTGAWECSSPHRARVQRGAVGARGPPVG
jgi:hypothetical protein